MPLKMHRRITRVVGTTVAAAALTVASPGVASASNAGGQSSLAAARAGTAAYHDASAVPSSYVPFLPCLSSPEGGMGKHFVDFGAVMDPAEDAAHPESLVYAETSTGYRLVAVEYIVPAGLVDPSNPPALFGQTFTAESVPGAGDLYVLHAWIWNTNPAGMFKDWNPALTSCSQSG
jgi:hypothetical protein